jgi:putative tricarboxylic transport membrane protein
MRANDALSGFILVALAAAMIAYTATFPAFPDQRYGPALFPRLLGVGLVLCGLALVVRGLAARRRGTPWLAPAPWTRQPGKVAAFATVLACLVAYVFLSESAGFLLMASAILAVLFALFRVRPLLVLPLAAGAAFAVHWFFGTIMRVPLPRGVIERLL